MRLLFVILLITSLKSFAQTDIDYNSKEYISFKQHYDEGKNYKDQKKLDLALNEFEQAKRIFIKNYGNKHGDYGKIVNQLAIVYYLKKEYPKALELYNIASKNAEKYNGRESPFHITVLDNIVNVFAEQKEYEKSIEKCLEIEKITKELNPIKRLEHLNNNYKIGVLYSKLKNYPKAIEYLKRTLEIANFSIPSNYKKEVFYTNSLADVYKNAYKFDKARIQYTLALNIIKTQFGTNAPEYSKQLNKIASFYETFGKYDDAISFSLKAVHSHKETFGENNPEYAEYINDLGLHYKLKGNYKEALSLYLKSIEITKELFDVNHPNYIHKLKNLAALYASLGQYNKALPIFIKTLEITEEVIGKNTSDYMHNLNNLAYVYSELYNVKKAAAHYYEALNISIELNSFDSPITSTIASNLSGVLLQGGDYEGSLKVAKIAIKCIENSAGTYHPSYGLALNNIALTYKILGQNETAIYYYNKALKNVKNTKGKNHLDYGIALKNLSTLYLSMNQHHNSYSHILNFTEIIQNKIKENFKYLTYQEKENFINNIMGQDLKLVNNFNYYTNNVYEPAVKIATNSILTKKSLLLNASKDIIAELKSLEINHINDKIDLFLKKKETLTKQLQLPIDQRPESFNTTKENLNSLERELVELYNSNFETDINYIKDFNKTKLKKDEIAIEFSKFVLLKSKDSILYSAYLYKKGWEVPKVVTLFEEKQLSKLLKNNNPGEVYSVRGSKGKSLDVSKAASDKIYELIWEPIDEYVEGSKAIYYSLDGLLHKIPFAALPNENKELLGERYNLHQMGNTADIRTHNNLPNLNDVILIGGIDYDYIVDSSMTKKNIDKHNILQSEKLLGNEKNRTRGNNNGKWTYLPGTKKEIDAIKELIPNSRILEKQNATELAFKRLSGNSPSVLHIATHGYFFPKIKRKRELEENIERPYTEAENPLLRCGLLMAHSNYAWQNGNNPYEEEDGILTGLEISNLDFKNTDIVILSACETGLGDIPSSEGVYGLQRAFKMAGVKTIIMSLWEVPDKETAEFMELFYTNWIKLNNPNKAFKDAQVKMMTKYRKNPEKWAAFVLFE